MSNTGITLKKILLPTDFSEASKQAFPHAVSFARQFNSSLTLVYVVPTTLPAELSHIGIVLEEKRLVREAGKALSKLREHALPSDIAVDTAVLSGGPYYEICKAARALAVDLIIMSTHGHTGLRHALLGSTTERVIRHATCPVLTIREQLVPMRFPDDAPCRFRNILAPTDFSEASFKAVRYTAAFAGLCGGGATLLHVVEPPGYPAWGYARLSVRDERLKKQAREKLKALSDELPSGLRTTTAVMTGDAASGIVEAANERKEDLIVMATRGHGGMRQALLGSTAEKVVRHATCPVLVVRENGHDFLSI